MLRVLVAVAVVLVVAGVGFVWWWNTGPAPEGEVRATLSSAGHAEAVTVLDCAYSEDRREAWPDAYREFDVFLCEIRSERDIRLGFDRRIPAGRSFFCFRVPRSAPRPWRGDYRALPYGLAPSPDSCFSRV